MPSVSVAGNAPRTGGVSTLKRKRPAACIYCHQRKVRCDARTVGVPCSNCKTAGKLDCRIHEKKKRAAVRPIRNPVPIRCAPFPDPNAPPSSKRSRLQDIDTLGHGGNHSSSSSCSSSPHQVLPGGDDLLEHPTGQLQLDPDMLRDDEVRRSLDRQHDMDRRLVKLIDGDSNPRSVKKGTRVLYVGQDVSNLNFLVRQQQSGKDEDEIHHFAMNEISRTYLNQSSDHHVPQDAFVLPEPALADELVEAYFEHINPGCPIVDEHSFLAQYRGRDPSDPPSLLILQSILLAGAHVSRQQPLRNALKSAFYRRAKMLFEGRVEQNRDILVQAALLLTWYSDPIDDDVAANAHYWVGVAARIATGLGMHRNSRPSRIVPADKRMWRRAWWILVQFDVLIALQYGRPQAINLEDCDADPLSPADFEGCGDRVRIDYVIHFTELCYMISFIMRERFGLRVSAERRRAVLSEADKALANWSIKLPDTLRMSATDLDSWPAALHLTYNNFLILLHRPHPQASKHSENDAEICSTAAGIIVSIFEELRSKDRIKYLWSSAVNALFTAMIQIRVELRFSNPVLAINALHRFDSTLSSLRSLAEYWYNAASILELFESSKRLKEDMEMVKTKQTSTEQSGDDGGADTKVIEESSAFDSERSLSLSNIHNWWPKPQLSDRLHHFNATDNNTLNSGNDDGSHDDNHDDDKADDNNDKQGPIAHGNRNPQPILLPGESDWKQLFTFSESESCGAALLPENINDMEGEWRELYLHDWGFPDYFQENTNTSWLQG